MRTVISLTAAPEESAPLTLQSAWNSVVSGVSWFFSNLSPAFAWSIIALAICVAFFVYYWFCLRPRPRSLEWIAMAEEKARHRRLTLTLPCHPMERGDILPILVITAVYAVTAFFQLGNLSGPESVAKFRQGDSYHFSYDQPVTVDKVSFFTSLGTGSYRLEWQDAEGNWQGVKLDQSYNTLFKWRVLDLNRVDGNGDTVSQDGVPVGAAAASEFRVVAENAPREEGLWLAELALWSGDVPVYPSAADSEALPLFDEPEEWTTKSTYMNSSYFDEIYHPRTALEHLNNVYPYEVSHPPLGKLILSIGIAIFGMVPFGWRFMGTLFGVLMLPVLYLFLKNLFGKTSVAACGTCLFAFDFMHLVQTRIATIDTYGVFFILVSYYFMYRWLAVPAGKKLYSYILPLFLSGVFWGIGCASKWTVVYAGVGLAVLWLLGMIFKAGDWREAEAQARKQAAPPEVRKEVAEAMFQEAPPPWQRPKLPSFAVHVVGTTLLSVLFFVLIPVVIYTVSYFPYAVARGNTGGFGGMLVQLFSWPFTELPRHLAAMKQVGADGNPQGFFDVIKNTANPVDIMLQNQHFMFTYHQGVHTPHPYESYWYQWIVDGRPILYYRDLDVPGVKSLFASFNNPLVSWTGLLAFIAVAIQTVRRKCGTGLFILIATLSQFVPWLPIGRILFAYHYFPTVLFLCFAIAYLMNDMMERKRKGYQLAVYGFTGSVVVVYALFYPELIGIYVPLWYSQYVLRWFPSWPL